MRPRSLIFALVAAALVAAAFVVPQLLKGRSDDWTTQSPEALAAFRAGLDARMRFYLVDAATSFRNALAADADFAAAKVQLADVSRDPEERKRLRAELEKTDVSRLNERERFLVELSRTPRDKQRDLTLRYIERHPRDSWGLFIAAGQAWDREEWEVAAGLYDRLLEVDPNWVTARNNLGYMAMAQARFAEAEEQFRTYAYVAPDQANPHDSLGELLSLLGRYDEARSELEQALAVRPDFCSSHEHLAGIAIFEGKPEAIEALVLRAKDHCPPEMIAALRCQSRLFSAYMKKDFAAPWRDGFASCAGKVGRRDILFYRLAILAGKSDEIAAEDAAIGEALSESREAGSSKGRARMLEAVSLHNQGLRELAKGDDRAAAESFRGADRRISFWGVGQGRFKLFNQLNLALALERSGAAVESEEVRSSVRTVNPAFADLYPSIAERSPDHVEPQFLP